MCEYCIYCSEEIIYDPVDTGAPRYTDFRHTRSRTRKCHGKDEYATPKDVGYLGY